MLSEDEDWIPLLTKRFRDFSPEEFKNYVRGLFRKRPAKKTKTIRLKKVKPPYVVSLTKKGNLSFKINRNPKWLTAKEVEGIAQAFERPVNEVWVLILKKKIVIVRTKEEIT